MSPFDHVHGSYIRLGQPLRSLGQKRLLIPKKSQWPDGALRRQRASLLQRLWRSIWRCGRAQPRASPPENLPWSWGCVRGGRALLFFVMVPPSMERWATHGSVGAGRRGGPATSRWPRRVTAHSVRGA